ncbi:MAG: hypothetical protein QOD99_2409 [Chthoniobacter sp.]|jgi:membrane-bound serine protease (ClpP class)|nr:hypothetical protein [Chthoniobacter sp.]
MIRFLVFLLLTCVPMMAAAGDVIVVPVHGEVSQAQFMFLRRALKQAESAGATAVVLDMNTYGGDLDAATKMLDALFKTSLPTLTYINTNAGSAGALVALSTKKIYMAPVSAIGAAAPVTGNGEELSPTMKDKTVSYFSGYFRSAAQRNGYNPDIAEAFISKEKEVKVGETIAHARGTLLTLSATEAAQEIGGKPLLAAGIAESLEDLLKKAGLGGSTRRIEPTGFESLAFWLTALAPLLLMTGVVCAYIEIKTPGFGIAGTVSAICFFLFFAGHYIAGLAGWEVAALFVAGAALVLGELLIHPGTVLPGVAGALMVFCALLWAMVDRYPGEPLVLSTGLLLRPVLNLLLTAALGAVAIALIARYLPRTSLFHRFVLGRANAAGPSFSTDTVASPARVSVGNEGIAISILRPSGNAQFGDTLVDVVTRGEFIESQAALRVLAVEGSRIVVEEKK